MGLLRGVARTAVVAGTATAVSNRVSRRQSNRWAAQEQQQYDAQQQYAPPPPQYAPPPPAAAPVQDPGNDMDRKIAQLKQLAELKQAGVLSDDEFQAQKAEVMAR